MHVHFTKAGDGKYLNVDMFNQYFNKELPKRNESAWCRFDWNRTAHLILYWCCDLHSNQIEHPKFLDATFCNWLYNPRNHAVGIFFSNHVFDTSRKSRIKHCI